MIVWRIANASYAALDGLGGLTVPGRWHNSGRPVIYTADSSALAMLEVRVHLDLTAAQLTRFVMLTRKNDVALDFDFDKVTEQSKDNPVFYVQYAHARIHSFARI